MSKNCVFKWQPRSQQHTNLKLFTQRVSLNRRRCSVSPPHSISLRSVHTLDLRDSHLLFHLQDTSKLFLPCYSLRRALLVGISTRHVDWEQTRVAHIFATIFFPFGKGKSKIFKWLRLRLTTVSSCFVVGHFPNSPTHSRCRSQALLSLLARSFFIFIAAALDSASNFHPTECELVDDLKSEHSLLLHFIFLQLFNSFFFNGKNWKSASCRWSCRKKRVNFSSFIERASRTTQTLSVSIVFHRWQLQLKKF